MHPLRLVVHLAIGKPENLETPPPQVEVTRPVGLECRSPTMKLIAVRLHRKAALAPEEVDLVRTDPYVVLRRRQPMRPAELEKPALQIASRRFGRVL
jgi:hypothetical protein